MEDKYAALLEKLAEKLGVAAEHLWHVLVQQAIISSITHLVVEVVFAAFLYIGWKKTLQLPNDYDSNKIPFVIFLVIMTAFFSLVVILSASEVVSGFLNPEYWALRQLMNLR